MSGSPQTVVRFPLTEAGLGKRITGRGLREVGFRKPPRFFDNRGVFDESTWRLVELSLFIKGFVSG